MSIDHRASTCTSCGKRLTRKQWYYRNNKYFCTKRCWGTEAEKVTAASASASSSEGAPPAAAAEKK